MHYKTLSTLLFASAALAAPTAQSDTSPPASELLEELFEATASGISSVLATAIPTPWVEGMNQNPTFSSSEVNMIMSGTLPAWYSSLPASVKSWATSAAVAEASEYSTGMPSSSAGAWSTSVESSYPYSWSWSSSPASTIIPTVTSSTTGSTSTGSFSSSMSTSSSASSSFSSSSTAAQSTSISTGGAPAATAGVAMGFAGAAGFLGIALAL